MNNNIRRILDVICKDGGEILIGPDFKCKFCGGNYYHPTTCIASIARAELKKEEEKIKEQEELSDELAKLNL